MGLRAAAIAISLTLSGWLSGCGTESSPPAAFSLDVPCDAAGQGCTARYGTMQLQVRLGPGVVALKPFPVRLDIAGNEEALQQVRVKFVMSGMSMGLNEYRMLAENMGTWKADVILPVCTSGRSDWMAEFTMESKNGRWSLVLPFVLHPPGSQ